jgi:chaperone modulatory protein CbpM
MNRDEFCLRVGVEIETLHVWIEEGWVAPEEEDFSDVDLARARLILDLERDLGVNPEGIGVVLTLLDQVHGLRRTLREVLEALAEREGRAGRPRP